MLEIDSDDLASWGCLVDHDIMAILKAYLLI